MKVSSTFSLPSLIQNIVLGALLFLSFGNIFGSNDLQKKALINHYKSTLSSPKNTFYEKIEALDTLLHYSYFQKDSIQYYKYKMQKANLFADMGYSFKAYSIYKALLHDLALASKSAPLIDSIIRKTTVLLSVASWQSGFYEEGLKISYDFLKQYTNPSIEELAQMYSNIGVIQMYSTHLSESKKKHLQAIDLLRKKPKEIDLKVQVRILNGYAGWFYINNQADSSLYYLSILEEKYLNKLDPLQASFYYNNLALIHFQLENYNLAESYLLTSLNYMGTSDEITYIKPRTLRNLGNLYMQRKLYTKAEQTYFEALKYAQFIKDKESTYKIFLALGNLYKIQNKTDLMQKYLLQGYMLKDSVIQKEYSERSSLLTRDFELYGIQKEQESLSQSLLLAQIGNENKIIALSVFGFLTLLFLGIALYMIYKLRESHKNKNADQIIINQKEQNVATAALLSIQKDEVLKKIKQYCIQLQKTDDKEDTNKIISNILHLITSCHFENSWEEFRLRFDTAYPHFYTRLQEKHPNLTKGERYFAALLALDINAKEIANLSQRSVRSVETYIYRIRKKTEMESDQKTSNYFSKFLEEQ